MFTGIVEDLGEVAEATRRGEALRLGIESSLPLEDVRRGESIAVDGVCLTVVEWSDRRFFVDVIPETLRCTTLGAAVPGTRVNLERALRVGDRLGGHFVQGHVDATAPVRAVRSEGEDYRLEVELVPAIAAYVAWKGSIALQGVSLTVAGLDGPGFEVALIPETLERTNLGALAPGDRVNVEVDLVARYLERLVVTRTEAPGGDHGRRT